MATDPWARFDSVLQKSKPPDPWKRFDAALPEPENATPGPWEEWEPRIEGLPILERRKLPSGEYEYREIFPDAPADPFAHIQEALDRGRATTRSPIVERDAAGNLRPRPIKGGLEAVSASDPLSAIDPAQHPHAAFGQQVLTRAAEGVASLGDLANLAVEPMARAVKYAAPPRDPGQAFAAHAQAAERTALMGGVIFGDLTDEREQLRDAYELERQKVAERLRGAPALAATADVGLDLVSDPTNLIPGGAGKVALREVGEEAVQRAAREAAALAPVRPPVDELAYTAEELADLAARKRGMARLGPEDIARTMPAEPPPIRLGSGIPDADIERRLGMRAFPEDAEELRRLSLPIGEEPNGPWSRFDDELARMAPEPSPVPPPGGRGDVVEIPLPQPGVVASAGAGGKLYHVVTGGRWDEGDLLPLAERFARGPITERKELIRLARRWPDLAMGEDLADPRSWSAGTWDTLERYAQGDAREVHFHETLAQAEDFAREYGGEILEVDPSGLTVRKGREYPHPVVEGLVPSRLIRRIERETPPPAAGAGGDFLEIPRPTPRGSAVAQAVLPPPTRHVSGGAPPQGDLPGIPSPSSTPLRMSTKGIENSTGLQDELHRVVEANRPELEAARGPVVPVSQWHDAPALAEKLGLAPEDYLRRPAGRGPMNADELSLGRHYLGQMKKEALDLEARIAAGDVPDRAVAETEKVARNRDVVRMMATLQGQGSSEAGRAMRSLQEALDPYGLADTPRDRVRLALLKKYKEANASEAARLEAAAVARLKRQAARETRKAKRAATAEELGDELAQLAQQFREASRKPRAFSTVVPLDPELVEVVGRMAANRVRAGVVAVEELADQVYTAVARQVNGVSREQVKAAIVEHGLARPAKVQKPPRDPAAAKLRAREQALARQVEKAEARLATGPQAPAAETTSRIWPTEEGDGFWVQHPGEKAEAVRIGDTWNNETPDLPETWTLETVEDARRQAIGNTDGDYSLVSPRLQELRQRLDEVRAQLAADPREGLAARYRELLDDQTIEMIATLPDPAEDPDALLQFLRYMERPTFRHFRTTYWINSILSGTKTTMRNLNGNVVRLVELTAMRPAGAAVEQGLARLQGRQAQRYVQEALPATMGVFRGVPEGMRRFVFVMREGYDPGRVVATLTEGVDKYDQILPVNPFLLSQNKAVRALGVPLTLPTRLLEATDAMAKVMASTSEMYAGATRTAIREGLDGDRLAARVTELIANPTDEMVTAADAFAKRATYQDPSSWVGNMAATIRRGPPGADELAAGLRAKGGVGNRLAAGLVQAPQTIGQHLLPFIHISDRVAASITDYIPLSKPFKLAREIAGQTPEAADLIARQVVGAGLGMLGIAWAAQGKLVGGAPKDEKLRNDFYAEGKQPYSLLVGGRWLPIRDTLGPWAGPFVAAAMYNDHLRAGEDPSAAIPGMALGSARYMLDASYLATLQQVMDAVDGESAGAGKKLESAGARVVAGYVPFSGFVRGAAQAMDTTTNSLGQTGPRVVEREGFVDELKSGIPGLRQDLPAKVGTLGEELVQATGRAGAFSPVVPTRNRVADPELAEDVERLRATLAARRREIGRVEKDIKDARKAKDAARVRKLQASLPRGATTTRLDNIMEAIRVQEMRIRKLRASGKPEDVIRRAEVEIQKRMAERLEKALAGLR